MTALLLMPFLGSMALLFIVISQFQLTKRHSLVNEYRISIKARRDRVLARYLLLAWAAEVAFMLLVSAYSPDAFNWW